MKIEYVPVAQVDPNPWQVRLEEDPQHIAMLAESMRANQTRGEHGMLQIPLARRSNGRVQLAFGMSRFAGWKEANPGDPFPVNLEELSDRQMSDLAAEENAKRKNLSAIEIATAIARRKKEFGLTDVEAGAPFGYKSASTISNLLRLLKLPAPVQEMVNERKMAERNARALLTVQRLDAKAVEKIAAESLSAENPEDFIDDQIKQLIQKKGESLENVPWKWDWPEQPIVLNPVPASAAAAGITEIPACHGCPFFFVRDEDAYCGRRECFELKLGLALPDALKAASRKLGIPAAGADEKAVVVYDGRGGYNHEVNALVADKRPELRLIGYPVLARGNANGVWTRRQLFGSPYIALGTLDKKTTEEWMNKPSKEQTQQSHVEKAKAKESETEKERKERIAEEEKHDKQRRKVHAAENKNKWEVIWLVTNTARLVAERMELAGEFTRFVDEIFADHFDVHSGALERHDEDLLKRIEKASAAESTLLLKEHIAFCVLAQDIVHHYNSDEAVHYSSLSQVHQEIEKWLKPYRSANEFEHFGIKLPNFWDTIPVLRTPFNCWHCGKFAPGEKITKRDQGEGWIDFGDKGVFCNGGHRAAFEKANKKVKGTKGRKAK